jgi:hypothetical protein
MRLPDQLSRQQRPIWTFVGFAARWRELRRAAANAGLLGALSVPESARQRLAQEATDERSGGVAGAVVPECRAAPGAESVPVDLGVDRCRLLRAMPEQLADLHQRRARAQQLGRGRVPQPVRANVAQTGPASGRDHDLVCRGRGSLKLAAALEDEHKPAQVWAPLSRTKGILTGTCTTGRRTHLFGLAGFESSSLCSSGLRERILRRLAGFDPALKDVNLVFWPGAVAGHRTVS